MSIKIGRWDYKLILNRNSSTFKEENIYRRVKKIWINAQEKLDRQLLRNN